MFTGIVLDGWIFDKEQTKNRLSESWDLAMLSTFTLKYVEIVRLQNHTENSASFLHVAPKVTYGHDEFGTCSKYAAQYCILTLRTWNRWGIWAHTISQPGTLQVSSTYTISSHSVGSSIWLLFQHVLAVSLSRFGVVVQAGKEHVNMSFFPSDRGWGVWCIWLWIEILLLSLAY